MLKKKPKTKKPAKAAKKTSVKTKRGAKQARPNMNIREARSDADYHRAFPIIRQLLPHLDMQTYARRVFIARATGYRMYIGLINKEVAGVIGIIANHNLHDGFVTYVEHVVVDDKFRGMGYGHELLSFAEKRAIEEGCNLIELDVDTGRDDVEKFYAKFGYQIIGKYHQKNLDPYKDIL
ncbi:MAG: GNAT family N-acetyltransferase [Alphaproteobacteria bacterium]|nr:GNAT family N-acetyltransferase [Alphaproteobacteria bacterium]